MTMNSCQSKNKYQVQETKNKNNEELNYVPNEETARKIAEAIWLPIYGESIYKQKPFVVTLERNIWIVEGSLPEGMKGGVAYIEIQKKDCKILKVIHSK
jgi:hypothetical protein